MMKIKNAKIEDLGKVIELENEIWPEETRASKEKFQSRLKIFPEGFFLAFDNGRLIGASTSEIIFYNPKNPPTSWEAITDEGYIRNHNPNGNALYVVSIGAVSRSGGGSTLINTQKNLTQKLNLRFLILGARIPGYNTYCQKNGNININDYVKLRREDNQLLDPELRFYTRNDLTLFKIMPNYMGDDKESRNYGAIMVWENKNLGRKF
ncbi:MAG TPA: hypothetical protein VMZ91_06730 [Candidatus Paceibacterota bacterium]|nr:hypothetical protein [Candidatus Paceibacterota bacterium]